MSLLRITLGGLGLVALSACFVACGDDDDKSPDGDAGSGGSTSTGGKSSSGGSKADSGAGGKGSGGKASGGSGNAGDASVDDGGSGEGGPGPTDGGGDGAVGDGGGTAVVKFCNDLTFGTPQAPQNVTFVLVIGTGASKVELEVTTGNCTPGVNLPCAAVGAGTDVPIDLFDKDDLTQPLSTNALDIVAGEEYVFKTILAGTPVGPDIDFFENPDNLTCRATTYDDVFPPNTLALQSTGKGGWSQLR